MSRPKLLLIDRNSDWLAFAKRVLQNAGYDVYIAEHVEVAFRLNSFNDFDLVLISLNQVDDLHNYTKTIDEKELPKRFVVTFPIRQTLEKVRTAFKAGADDCVDKPFDEVTMLNLISEQIEYSKQPKTIEGIDLSTILDSPLKGGNK